jgi:hypothetical protein
MKQGCDLHSSQEKKKQDRPTTASTRHTDSHPPHTYVKAIDEVCALYTEYTATREVFRSGQSLYLLSTRTVSVTALV